MRKLVFLVLLCIILSGCGETFSGAAKDVNRWGKGTKTVIFRDE